MKVMFGKLIMFCTVILLSLGTLATFGYGQWVQQSDMQVTRESHTATLLDDGRVLITGGAVDTAKSATSACEIFDPANNTSVPVASMATPRLLHAAIKLGNGKVLVAGGAQSGGTPFLSSCEIYDPVANSWSNAQPLGQATANHRLVTLTVGPNAGKVMRVCGSDSGGFGTGACEIYDPTSDTWTNTGFASVGRQTPAVAVLQSGEVICAGGYPYTTSVEIYDPVSGTWSSAGNLSNAVSAPEAVVLDDGRVLIMGGEYWSGTHSFYTSTDIYNPTSGAIAPGPDMLTKRSFFQALKLPDGDILAIGGRSEDGTGRTTGNCDRYDFDTAAWSAADVMSVSRTYFSSIYANGKVFVFGGRIYDSTQSVVASIEALQISPVTQTITISPGIDMEFVLVPAGSSIMGAFNDSWANADESPLTNITITQGFWLGKFEVTQEVWEAVTGTNPAGRAGVGPDLPVYDVSWNDCQAFIAQLNTLGLGTFRLPWEAEWEYAYRAGTTSRFYYGNSNCNDRDCSACDLSDYAWSCVNAGGVAHSVGQKPPNPFGLYDMAGNVGELCQSYFGTYPGGSVTDYVGPATGTLRISRGGGWGSWPIACRASNRGKPDPTLFWSDTGLRLVWEPPYSAGVPGDVNCDGVADIIDTLHISQKDAGLRPTLDCPQNGDVNCDGVVDLIDALFISQYDSGLRPSLPDCP